MRKFALILLCLVAFAAAGWFTIQRLTRSPLDGETHHRFGRIAMPFGAEVPLRHTFRLVNRTGKAITINVVKPDCSCVSVGEFARTVQPGAEFQLPVTMNFTGPSKTVPIMMDLGEAGLEALRVSAESQYLPALRSEPTSISLNANQEGSVTILADIFSTLKEPAVPQITTSDGVQAQWQGWKLKWQSPDPNAAPVQWRGELVLRATTSTLPNDAHITVQLEPAAPLRININSANATPTSATPPETQPAQAPADR